MKKNLEKDFKKAAEEENIYETKDRKILDDEGDLEREVTWGNPLAKKPEEDDLERDTTWKRDPVPTYVARAKRIKARV